MWAEWSGSLHLRDALTWRKVSAGTDPVLSLTLVSDSISAWNEVTGGDLRFGGC